jgi:NADPH2:quinone reductase
VTGIASDGGYAEYMTAPAEAVAAVPDNLESAAAAPLMCAGITTYNALRNAGAKPGDLVAVQGVGGLGHLGIQYAHAAGFETVAVSRGTDKRDLAMDLGADHYVDSEAEDPGEALVELGGARIVLATAPNTDAIESVVSGLGVDGEVLAVGIPGEVLAVGIPGEPVEVSVQDLVMGRRSVAGWPSGDARDSQDTLEFSALRDIEPMIESYPLEEAADAYERMLSNDARFRVVLEP